MKIEHHPLAPFLPLGATTLFLGSFPPPRERWSMDFFYPNFINDFWRVMGLVHFGDAGWFEISRQARNDSRLARKSKKGFDRERIVAFCEQKGLAFFDTATAVRRLKDNASDAFLEVVEPTDVGALVARLPACRRIVTTGGKASEELLDVLAKEIPGQARNDGRGARNDGRGARNKPSCRPSGNVSESTFGAGKSNGGACRPPPAPIRSRWRRRRISIGGYSDLSASKIASNRARRRCWSAMRARSSASLAALGDSGIHSLR